MCLQGIQAGMWEGIETMHPAFLHDNGLSPTDWKKADSGCTVRPLLSFYLHI